MMEIPWRIPPVVFGYAIAVSKSSWLASTSGCVSSFIDTALK
jgi:hypothetical protein